MFGLSNGIIKMVRILFRFDKYFLLMIFLLFINNEIYSQGSPPLLVDDTGTPGNGNWEINLVASLGHSEIADEWEAPLFDINYGLGERLQLKVESPYIISKEENGESDSGFEGIKFGVKYRFYSLEDRGISISCYPQIFSPFYKTEDSEIFLPIEGHVQWETIGLTGEIGHGWIGSDADVWEAGIGVGCLFRNVEFLFEWHSAIGTESFELSEPMLNFGFAWDWMEASSLLFSIGKSINNRKDETNLWSLCGVQFLL